MTTNVSNGACAVVRRVAVTAIGMAVLPSPVSGQCDPPIPGSGQTVNWTSAMSPVRICQNTTIPAGATVLIEAGVTLEVLSGVDLAVEGELIARGAVGSRVNLIGAGEIVVAGRADLDHISIGLDFDAASRGLIGISNGTVDRGSRLDTFTRDAALILDGVEVLSQSIFFFGQVAYNDVTFHSVTSGFGLEIFNYYRLNGVTVRGGPLRVANEHQPKLLSDVDVNGNGTDPALTAHGGGVWRGSNLLIDAECDLVNGSFPVHLSLGGLHPESSVPATGNVNNMISMGFGAGSGVGNWPKFDIPYYVEDEVNLTGRIGVGAGARFLLDRFASVDVEGNFFDDTPIFRGRPGARLELRPVAPGVPTAGVAMFNGIVEHLDVTEGRITSTSGFNKINECVVHDGPVGIFADASAFVTIRGTQVLRCEVGVEDDMTSFPALDMNGTARANIFEGNVLAARNNSEPNGNVGPFDVMMNWWGHPSGPSSPFINPSGLGDPIGFGVDAAPWRTERPDLSDTPPQVSINWPYLLAEPGDTVFVSWEAEDNSAIASQRIRLDVSGGGNFNWVVLADGLDASRRSAFVRIPAIGQTQDARSTLLQVEATDDSGYTGSHEITLQVPVLERPDGSVQFTTDVRSGFTPGQEEAICYSAFGTAAGSNTVFLSLDTEANPVFRGPGGNAGNSCTFSSLRFPPVSTNRARFVLFSDGIGNDNDWYFSEPFEIRPIEGFPDQPAELSMLTPPANQTFRGGGSIPFTWTASDDEGLREFRIQASLNGGRTWSTVATVGGTEFSYDWRLPPLDHVLDDVRVRVVAVDHRFQATADGDDRPITLIPGDSCYADCDGGGSLDIFDFVCFQDAFASGDPYADCTGNGALDIFDFLCFQDAFASGCP